MKYAKEKIIKCPECGWEYLPAEIYYPNSFLGKPKDINKEYLTGKILDYMGNSMNLSETFICDNCGTNFKTTAVVNFNTVKTKDSNYKTKLKKEKLFLSEN